MDRDAPTPGSTLTRRLRLAAALGLAAMAAGCSGSGTLTRRPGMLGALKTNVAQLESEKEGLTRELAASRAENRRIESQLAEAEAQNGELTARLDDARAVMSRQGIEEGRPSASRSASDSDRPTNGRAKPARAQPKGRRAPFAQIPADRRPLDEPDDDGRGSLDEPQSRRDRDDFPAQSRLNDGSPWLPVARGRGPAAATTR